MDNDAEALQLASAAVTIIDLRYRRADAIEKDQLADARDRAWTAYALARQRMLASGVIVTDEQLADLDQMSRELGQAAETAALVNSVVKIAGLLGRIALA